VAEAQVALAECLVDLGERAGAQALLTQARNAQAAHAELAPHLVQPLQAAQARAREPSTRR
jgi:thioredoxin-like negative regulator of GroEL